MPKRPAAKPARPAKPTKPAPVRPAAKPAPAAPAATRRVVLSSTSPVRGETKAVSVAGPCRLLGACAVLSSAGAGISPIGLEIDGELLHLVRCDQLVQRGHDRPNPTGAYATHAAYGNTWSAVFGWSTPVAVAREVRLLLQVAEDIAEVELAIVVTAAT